MTRSCIHRTRAARFSPTVFLLRPAVASAHTLWVFQSWKPIWYFHLWSVCQNTAWFGLRHTFDALTHGTGKLDNWHCSQMNMTLEFNLDSLFFLKRQKKTTQAWGSKQTVHRKAHWDPTSFMHQHACIFQNYLNVMEEIQAFGLKFSVTYPNPVVVCWNVHHFQMFRLCSQIHRQNADQCEEISA